MPLSRRQLLSLLLAGASLPSLSAPAAELQRRLRLAGNPIGDPGDDWARFAEQTGWSVEALSISDAPDSIRQLLSLEGAAGGLDLLHSVGGLLHVLADNRLIEPIETERLSHWQDNDYIQNYFGPETAGFSFIGSQERVYGVPTLLQGESFLYLPEATGKLESYGALFDPQWRGQVAMQDDMINSGHKTALYLKESGLAAIEDPGNLLPGEIRSVVDFLIDQKRQGQFRTLWTSLEEALNLLVAKEVVAIECPEALMTAARAEGVNAVQAAPLEGYLLWALTASIVRAPEREEPVEDAIYDLIDFMLGGWYGARLGLLRGAMTNPRALRQPEEQPENFKADEAVRLQALDSAGRLKFERGGVWHNRWPTHRKAYEAEWSRFKTA